jgi:N-acetylglucosamine-6-phosphate deacetylase
MYGKAVIEDNEPIVKIITIAPEVAGALEGISHLEKKGWIISLGHT